MFASEILSKKENCLFKERTKALKNPSFIASWSAHKSFSPQVQTSFPCCQCMHKLSLSLGFFSNTIITQSEFDKVDDNAMTLCPFVLHESAQLRYVVIYQFFPSKISLRVIKMLQYRATKKIPNVLAI